MKINPIGIQSYQQVNHQNNSGRTVAPEQDVPRPEKPVTITPQPESAGSKLAIKTPGGNYAEFLTEEEKQALELLFTRFRDSSRFGAGY